LGTTPGGQDDLGFDKVKRKLASASRVSVYSSNAALQAELDRFASAAAFNCRSSDLI